MQLQKIFQTAFNYGASDVYISAGSKPALRINGELVVIEEHPLLTKKMAEDYIFETLNDDQRARFARTLDLDYALDVLGVGRFRANVFMQHAGIGSVFRVIPEEIKSLDSLNLPTQLKQIADYRQGIVLLTGPTGSGKSTTLAAILDEINRKHSYNIITIEDPIEFIHKHKRSFVQQREVGVHTGSFATALKASLRESVDVILVGEMRDHETIALALTAAETGHLVLATLHTSGAGKSVDRIIDVFPSSQQNQIRAQLAQSLRAVIWQQLLKTPDGRSRVAALEIMFANNAIQNLIRKGKTFQIQSVLETGMREGMQTMERAVKNLAEQGFITQETANEQLAALIAGADSSEAG